MGCAVSQCGTACLVSVVWWATGIRVSGDPAGSLNTGSALAAAWSVLMPYRKWETPTSSASKIFKLWFSPEKLEMSCYIWIAALKVVPRIPKIQPKSNYPAASPDGKVIKAFVLTWSPSLACPVCAPALCNVFYSLLFIFFFFFFFILSFITNTFKQRWALHVHDSSPDWWNCHSSLQRG